VKLARLRKPKATHFLYVGPVQMQAILYIPRNVYRTCIQKWDWQRRPREEEKEGRKDSKLQ
jgi:hypothetical protein